MREQLSCHLARTSLVVVDEKVSAEWKESEIGADQGATQVHRTDRQGYTFQSGVGWQMMTHGILS